MIFDAEDSEKKQISYFGEKFAKTYANQQDKIQNLQIQNIEKENVNNQNECNHKQNPINNINNNKNKQFDPYQWSIDNFEIGRPLGNGQFGHVYLAREKQSKFIVALKIMKKKKIQKETSENYVRSELEILCHLKHKNIINFYGYFWDQDQIYCIMEYANGGEVFSDMKKNKNGRYPEEIASIYISQVAECLKYLHKQQIIHRDIKPENLLLVNGIIKLTDFGYSAHTPNNTRKTRCGTLDYFPFEMASQQKYDNTVDIWSLGILAYEFCAGQPPFESKEQSETLNKIKNINFSFPSHFSIELIDFIKNLILKDAAKRMSIDQILEHKWIKMHSKQ